MNRKIEQIFDSLFNFEKAYQFFLFPGIITLISYLLCIVFLLIFSMFISSKDAMKYTHIFSFIVVLFCIFFIHKILNRTFEKQKTLEDAFEWLPMANFVSKIVLLIPLLIGFIMSNISFYEPDVIPFFDDSHFQMFFIGIGLFSYSLFYIEYRIKKENKESEKSVKSQKKENTSKYNPHRKYH